MLHGCRHDVSQTVLEETLCEAKDGGSYGGITESVDKSRNRNKEKSAIGYVKNGYHLKL